LSSDMRFCREFIDVNRPQAPPDACSVHPRTPRLLGLKGLCRL